VLLTQLVAHFAPAGRVLISKYLQGPIGGDCVSSDSSPRCSLGHRLALGCFAGGSFHVEHLDKALAGRSTRDREEGDFEVNELLS